MGVGQVGAIGVGNGGGPGCGVDDQSVRRRIAELAHIMAEPLAGLGGPLQRILAEGVEVAAELEAVARLSAVARRSGSTRSRRLELQVTVQAAEGHMAPGLVESDTSDHVRILVNAAEGVRGEHRARPSRERAVKALRLRILDRDRSAEPAGRGESVAELRRAIRQAVQGTDMAG